MNVERSIGLAVVADDSASSAGVARALLAQVGQGANPNTLLISTSATLAAAVGDEIRHALLGRPELARLTREVTPRSIVTVDLADAAAIVTGMRPLLLRVRLREPGQFLEALSATREAPRFSQRAA